MDTPTVVAQYGDEIVELYIKGYSIRKIKEQLHINTRHVYLAIKAAGIEYKKDNLKNEVNILKEKVFILEKEIKKLKDGTH